MVWGESQVEYPTLEVGGIQCLTMSAFAFPLYKIDNVHSHLKCKYFFAFVKQTSNRGYTIILSVIMWLCYSNQN